jgi:hypothetical protein
MFKIKQDNCSTDLHADLDLVDIPTHLGVFFVFWKAATKQNKRLHFPWFESGFFTVATEELTLSISIL